MTIYNLYGYIYEYISAKDHSPYIIYMQNNINKLQWNKIFQYKEKRDDNLLKTVMNNKRL